MGASTTVGQGEKIDNILLLILFQLSHVMTINIVYIVTNGIDVPEWVELGRLAIGEDVTRSVL